MKPDTTYDFRIVATNTVGTTDGGEQTFTTAAIGATGGTGSTGMTGVTSVTSVTGPTGAESKPAISGLSIKPRKFKVAGAKPKPKGGATISYTDSATASATLTVLRPTSGVVAGKGACLLPSRKRHGALALVARHCTVDVKVGSFTHADTAGRNSVRFSGRLGKRTLKPGTYELLVTARDSAGTGNVATLRFVVVS